jgi:hypothetical protein
MHTLYLIHIFTTLLYMFRCISHHLPAELKFFLLKTICFVKAYGFEYVLNWLHHKIYNSVGSQYFNND